MECEFLWGGGGVGGVNTCFVVEEVSLVFSSYLSYLQVMLMLEKQKYLDLDCFPNLLSDFSNESLALIKHLHGFLCIIAS